MNSPFLMKSLQVEEYVYESEEGRASHISKMESEGWCASSQMKSNMQEYGQSDLGYMYVGKFTKEIINQHPQYAEEKAKSAIINKMKSFSSPQEEPKGDLAAWGSIIIKENDKGSASPFYGFNAEETEIFFKAKVILEANPVQVRNLKWSTEQHLSLMSAAIEQLESFVSQGKVVVENGKYYSVYDINKKFGVARK